MINSLGELGIKQGSQEIIKSKRLFNFFKKSISSEKVIMILDFHLPKITKKSYAG